MKTNFSYQQFTAIAVLVLVHLFNNQLQAQSKELVGTWYTEEKKAKVDVYSCGGKFCGKIIWMDEPNEPDGTPKLDNENPEEELRDQTILGLQILSKLQPESDQVWKDGEIYDPESGNTYSCYVELVNENKLKLRGYLGFSLLGRTSYWTRAN